MLNHKRPLGGQGHRGVVILTPKRHRRFIREGRFKYIQTPYRQTEELYNLSADPLERDNLLADPTPEMQIKAQALRRKLDAWTNSARPLPTRFQPSQRQETVRRLRSLGYLGGNRQSDAPDNSANED